MQTLDEQLDEANAKVNELNGQVAALQTSLQEAEQAKTVLETANAELVANLADAKDKLAKQELATQEAQTQVEQLKAEAKTAEERAADIYGATAGKPAAVTAKGDTSTLSVLERFKAISTPSGQTQFLRSLSDAERAELYSNL